MMTDIWDILFLAKRLYDQPLQPVCDQAGITRMELDILLFLANNPAYDTAKDIIERRRLTKSHVSASVRDLTDRKWLEPSFQQNNRKTIHLRLLPAADDVVQHGRRAQVAFFSRLFEGFTSEEVNQIHLHLAQVAENAREALTGGMKNAR